jgi:hypothetical protein
MAKLIRKVSVSKEDLVEQGVVNETKEAEETMPIMTSNSKIDLSEVAMGNIKLECLQCGSILEISRGLIVTIACVNCVNKKFISKSNFVMSCPEEDRTINAGDRIDGSRGGSRLWSVS